ncbi:MAG: hypothetical protein QOE54_58 [Streptosporangiaceae bacterium]|jgi:hypothetical protein|nr:hypothetical protein [Streptosporangiaceae bacterium]MDX6427692.1 hypothetical protein [Streptosporangiaceae bacterium]
MTRQIAAGYGIPSGPALEERIHILESKVNAMAEAILILAGGLEGTPMDGPRGDGGSRAARLAHDVLIAAQVTTHDSD